MSDDWMDIAPPEEKAGLPILVTLPDGFAARLALVEASWARLSDKQKIFLNAWRECRYNAHATARHLAGVVSRTSHVAWMRELDYATVVRIWRANAAANALDRDRLLARQDDIVETLLTPKPILQQGLPTGFYEIEAGAAGRANEALLDRVMPKSPDVQVNVGVAFAPTPVEFEKTDGAVIDVVDEVVEAGPVLPE